MPGMGDGTFAGTVVYLCEHTEKGALGLVINKPIDITLKNLFEKVELSLDREDLADAPVYFGGPVQTERGFVLHEPTRRRRRRAGLQLVAEDRGRPRDDDQQGRARGAGERRRAEEGAGHARLQRLGRGPARGRDRQQRLDQRRGRARDHLRHAGRASATTRRCRCSASTPACSARRRGTREPPGRCQGGLRCARRAGSSHDGFAWPPLPPSPPSWPSISARRRVGVASGNCADRQRRAAAHRRRRRARRASRRSPRLIAEWQPDGAGRRRAASIPTARPHDNTERARRFGRRAARPLRPAGARGRRALHHDRGARRAARATSTPRRRRSSSSSSSRERGRVSRMRAGRRSALRRACWPACAALLKADARAGRHLVGRRLAGRAAAARPAAWPASRA